jgi:hypothetical protein
MLTHSTEMGYVFPFPCHQHVDDIMISNIHTFHIFELAYPVIPSHHQSPISLLKLQLEAAAIAPAFFESCQDSDSESSFGEYSGDEDAEPVPAPPGRLRTSFWKSLVRLEPTYCGSPLFTCKQGY